MLIKTLFVTIGVARGAKGAMRPQIFRKVILCFERRFSKQNSVIRLKSNILATPKFWAGYASVCYHCRTGQPSFVCTVKKRMPQTTILKPEPGSSPTFISEARFRPKTRFAELVKIRATVGCQKT